MPRPPRACAEPGCGQPAWHPHNRCEPHRLAQRKANDQHRPNARARGYDARWQRTRAAYLAAHPLCAHCGKPGQHVDHIDGGGPLAPNGHDPTNLQTLCAPCHSRKTNAHDGGGWGGTGGS